MIFIPESLQKSFLIPFLSFPKTPNSELFSRLGPLRSRMLLLVRLQGIDEMLDG